RRHTRWPRDWSSDVCSSDLALTTIIREDLGRLAWRPEHYVLSFHGLPIRYAKSGDPYATHVKRTTAALVQRLGWPRAAWSQTFQIGRASCRERVADDGADVL